jgi:hypothetical protein
VDRSQILQTLAHTHATRQAYGSKLAASENAGIILKDSEISR